MKNINCYIHIPFCTSKCKYCRFASFSGLRKVEIERYVDFLCKEIYESGEVRVENGEKFGILNNQTLSNPFHLTQSSSIWRGENQMGDGKFNKEEKILDTIYFGGGTPGVLEISQLEKIFQALKNKFKFSENIEITIEVNPENITKENLIGWEKLGINRISIGVQTLKKKSLFEIGRGDKGDIFKALEIIKTSPLTPLLLKGEGNDGNISFGLDFILGLPFVSKGEIGKNIEELILKYDFIKHISVYMLENHDNYPEKWKNISLKENDYLAEYSEIVKILEKRGFERYEISNFVKKSSLKSHPNLSLGNLTPLSIKTASLQVLSSKTPHPLPFGSDTVSITPTRRNGISAIRRNPPTSLRFVLSNLERGGLSTNTSPFPLCFSPLQIGEGPGVRFEFGEGSEEVKQNYKCKHNLGYWNHKEFIGFGLGAYSFIENVRFSNAEKLDLYYKGLGKKFEKLTKKDLFLEKIMFDLRTKGVCKNDFKKLNQEKIKYFIAEGFLELKEDKIILTNSGILVLDYILSEIL